MLKNVVLVHGYSVQSLSTYGTLPQMLQASGFNAHDIFLSAYDSLNDDITCSDLANALEVRMSGLEKAGLDMAETAIIVHSTGAIVVRRWMLNRWAATPSRPLPSHFVSLAGANHGSTLAQLGETQLAYLFRAVGGTSVGLEVLQDLDYGSAFLLKLNEDWLDAYLPSPQNPSPPSTLCFSMIGDDHSAWTNQIFWQSHESGSDCTVRICGGNLNYRIMSYDQTAQAPALTCKELPYSIPHLVLKGVSHTGKNGILGGDAATMDLVYPFIEQALKTDSPAAYTAVEANWRGRTEVWNTANEADCNSTIVFALTHPGGRNIKDSLILIKDGDPDETTSVLNVSNAIEPHQPIQNETTPSSVSFYVNYGMFVESYPHTVSIQINSGCDEIAYPSADFVVKANDSARIRPNEFVYVKVTLNREAVGTYSVIPVSQNPNMTKTWPPLPPSSV